VPQKLRRPAPRDLLKRLIESPSLIAALQSLEPRHLAKLIDHVALEDCGEILRFATTDQLASIFDEDLWKSASIAGATLHAPSAVERRRACSRISQKRPLNLVAIQRCRCHEEKSSSSEP
jgi:hypothetical protein